MTDETTLRLLGPLDAVAYKQLRDTMLALHSTAFTSDAETERARPASSYAGRLGVGASAHAFTIGAWRGGVLVGAVTGERDRRRKASHVAQLLGMMVHVTAEHHGIGGQLLAACLDRLRSDGDIELVTLSVTTDNQRAVHLYERAGFRRYGILPRAIRVGDRYHDKASMVLSIREPG